MKKVIFGSKRLIYSSVLLCSLLLTGCGSSGGSGGGGNPANNPPSGISNTIAGSVVDAFISGAKVNAYQVNSNGTQGAFIAGPATTDSNGNYSLNLGAYTGTVYLSSTGGSYVDTATGNLINLTSSNLPLSEILQNASGSVIANITPLSTMAAQSALILISNGIPTATAAANANTLISNYFGISSNLLNTALPDLTKVGCATGAGQSSIDYAMILAGISQLASNNKVNPADLVNALVQDVISDGSFDGKASGTAINVPLSPSPGQVSLSTIEGNALSNLPAAITTFMNSAANSCKAQVSSSVLTGFTNGSIFPQLAAPTGVTATSGNGSVAISWNPVSGATSYNLYMVTQTGVKKGLTSLPGYQSHLNVTSPDTESGLSNGTTYYFVVTAVNGVSSFGSESVESAEVSATPQIPVGLSVSINQSSPQSVNVNGTINFTATVYGSTNQTVTWRVQEATGCGSITQSGVYNAPSAATTCHATATSVVSPNPTATVTVNVTQPVTLGSILVAYSNPTIAPGLTSQFNATGYYSDGSSQNITSTVTWSSSNSSVAAISNTAGSNGLATGVSSGTTTISASLGTIIGNGLTITVPQSGIHNQWTWVSGSNAANVNYVPNIMGTKGSLSASNAPFPNIWASSWTDLSGNLWLFGGIYDGFWNDLIKFDGSNWTWVSGSNTIYPAGVWGTKGIPGANNVPGPRYMAVSWTDKSGNLWLFGGNGSINVLNNLNTPCPCGYFNDMWEFNPTSLQWTWVSGSNTTNQVGVYGTKGTPAPTNVPGARMGSATWTDLSGNLWLFGGNGGTTATFNDLWKFDGTNWTWVSGSNTTNQPAVYGTKGTPAPTNMPGSRGWGAAGASWIDKAGNLWFFGGSDSTGAFLNDLWKFDGTNWTWVSGGNIVSQKGVYGTLGTAAATNIPGARAGAASWIDGSGNFWLFGGTGHDSSPTTGADLLNDLWEFNPATLQWTWVSGSNTIDKLGVYGTKGIPAASNIPGSRSQPVSGIDKAGNLWLWGGEGYDSVGGNGALNDLWLYQP